MHANAAKKKEGGGVYRCKQSFYCMQTQLYHVTWLYKLAVNRASIARKRSLFLLQTEPLLHES
ncbi:hypothetical protein HMPREF1981_02453 [Bacteroides pyogenes F0041]|uniref:Uncharacterized protein n=1 Tax=Bacteroides pyogenes F0041 TaxID=1321819 RepID=U2C103_9BACE|nr:hypothetical protein HMPREF1981_02453 [Bacteroides pyogenes F0041]